MTHQRYSDNMADVRSDGAGPADYQPLDSLDPLGMDPSFRAALVDLMVEHRRETERGIYPARLLTNKIHKLSEMGLDIDTGLRGRLIELANAALIWASTMPSEVRETRYGGVDEGS